MAKPKDACSSQAKGISDREGCRGPVDGRARLRRPELYGRKPDACAVNNREYDVGVEALLHMDGTCIDGANGPSGGDDDACGDNDGSGVWNWAAGLAAGETSR